MKLIAKITVLLTMLMVYTACEDSRLDNVPVDGLSFLNSGLQRPTVFNFGTKEYDVVVSKSGLGNKAAAVEISVNSQLITDYNTANTTSFELLPTNCYTLSPLKSNIEESGTSTVCTVTLNTLEMEKLANPSNHILPFQLQADIDVANNKSTLLLAPNFVEPYISFTRYNEIQQILVNPEAEVSRGYIGVGVNYNNEWNLTYEIEVDETALADYNAANSKTFEVFPEGTYSIDHLDWHILSGNNSKTFTVKFTKNALNNANKYLLPLKIKSVSKWGVNTTQNVQLISIKSSAPGLLEKTDWTILDCNSSVAVSGANEFEMERGPISIIDGINTCFTYATTVPTFWAAKSGAAFPVYTSVDMKAMKTISKLEVHNPGGADAWRSSLKKGHFEISNDGNSWTKAGDWVFASTNVASATVTVTPMVAARYVKLVVTETFGGAVAVREIEVYGFD